MPNKKHKKPTRDVKQLALIESVLDHVEAKRFVDKLRADSFMGIFLQLAEVYLALGEPFVTRMNGGPSFNLRLLPQHHKTHTSPPMLNIARDYAAFSDQRDAARASAGRIVASWEKAGIPAPAVWDLLEKANPGKKRFLSELAVEHDRIVSTIEAHREACFQLTLLTRLDTALIFLQPSTRAEVARAAILGVEACTKALLELARGSKILDEAKRQFVHVRNSTRPAVERGLGRLRQRHLKNEKPSTTAQRSYELLVAWAPDTKWNASSIRVGLYPRKPGDNGL